MYTRRCDKDRFAIKVVTHVAIGGSYIPFIIEDFSKLNHLLLDCFLRHRSSYQGKSLESKLCRHFKGLQSKL